MEFIKQMKKREFIEMTLKTVAAFLALFLAVILMEGMIYGIKLNALLEKKGTNPFRQDDLTIAYCVEQDNGKYAVIYYNEGMLIEWSSHDRLLSFQDVQSASFKSDVKEVIMHAPTAFDMTITPTHFIIIAVVTAALAGFFTYKFIKLGKEYSKIEENFIKTGAIEIG